ncbi:MAG: FecR domain-containing protein [Pseudomonadota bacterium]
MTQETSKEDALFEEALDLIIRLQNDPGNPVAHDLVQRWRARGAEHEAAWLEVAEIHGMAGKVLVDRREAERAATGVSRRSIVIGGVAALVAAGTGALVGPELLLRFEADQVTTTAELRRVTLADGTIVTMGPNTAITSRFTPQARRVDLLEGMAFFEVARDERRPFRAITADLTTTVLGTAFDISHDAGNVTVSVDHGEVQVAMPNSSLIAGAKLSMGDWITVDSRTRTVERGTRERSQIAAWRDGMIVAERETVASVVARIARWQAGRVLIADPSLGGRRISGVFDLHDPVLALEAVIQPHGGKVRQVSPWLTVLSPI